MRKQKPNAKRPAIRVSLEEGCPTRAEYLSRLTKAARKLQADGFLLDEDVTRIIERGAKTKLDWQGRRLVFVAS